MPVIQNKNTMQPIYDPTTGLWQVNGQVVQKNPDGTFSPVNQVTQPGQVVKENALSTAFNTAAQPWGAKVADTFGKQMGLADSLNNIIQNEHAPSVARQQLLNSTNAAESSQLSMAAGAGGGNGVIARTDAANNMAGLDAQANRDAALLRAQEVGTATGQLGAVLGQAQTGAAGMYHDNTGLGLQYQTAAGTTGSGDLDRRRQQSQDTWNQGKDVATGAGSIAASGGTSGVVPSDERVKHDINAEPDAREGEFLRAMSPKSFSYNDDGADAPERHGVMAQDLEKSDIGKGLVRKGKGGVKGFDIGQGLGAALGALAYLQRRLDALEADGG